MFHVVRSELYLGACNANASLASRAIGKGPKETGADVVLKLGWRCQHCAVTDQGDVVLFDSQLFGVSPGFNKDGGARRCIVDGCLDRLAGVDVDKTRVLVSYSSSVLGPRTS